MPMGGNMIAIKGIILNSFFIKPVYPRKLSEQIGCHWHSGHITDYQSQH